MSEYAPTNYEQLGPNPLVREALIAATFDPCRALDASVETLRLYDTAQPGTYNLVTAIEAPLRAVAFDGPTKSPIEWYMDIFVTNARKLSFPKAPKPGTTNRCYPERGITVKHVAVAGEALVLQDQYVGAYAHTHPNGTPLSGTDLTPLFESSECLGAGAAAWAITENGTWMVFRGARTPEWTEKQAKGKSDEWMQAVGDRTRKFLHPSMTIAKQWEINHQVQVAFLSQAAGKYGLQFFYGSKGSTELTRLFQ